MGMKRIENKTKLMHRVEQEMGYELEEVMRTLYVDEKLTQIQIAQELGVTYQTVINWLTWSGVYSRGLDL